MTIKKWHLFKMCALVIKILRVHQQDQREPKEIERNTQTEKEGQVKIVGVL